MPEPSGVFNGLVQRVERGRWPANGEERDAERLQHTLPVNGHGPRFAHHHVQAVIAHHDAGARADLSEAFAKLWPGLEICAAVDDGVQALSACEIHRPSVVILGVGLQGLTGIEVARVMGDCCHVVLIADDKCDAADAFEAGAFDYVLRPVPVHRLWRTVSRLKARTQSGTAPAAFPGGGVLHAARGTGLPLRWLTTHKGEEILLIDVAEVCYCQSENKHVAVVTADARSTIRTPLQWLIARLDPADFWQIHRTTIVNVRAIQKVVRDASGHLGVRLKARHEVLKVSEAFAWRFKHL